MAERYNVSRGLADIAARAPYRPGIILPAGRERSGRARVIQLSFRQLDDEVNRYAHGLAGLGLRQGDRVLMMVRPGVELIALTFALVRIGAVPVLIDPGMGRRAFLRCVGDAAPTAMIGVPAAHLLRRLAPQTFRRMRHFVVVGSPASAAVLGGTPLGRVRTARRDPYPIAPTTPESEAAIAFTSGSTGDPKGVLYLHGTFGAQIDLLRHQIGIQEGEVDLALLYIFALFNPALGVTTVIPDMDPTRSAEVNPAYVVEAIQTFGVTNAFGSPTIWKRVVPYCQEHGIRLPSLKRVLMAGAPVPPWLIRSLLDDVLAPDADVNTPFGATEAMPLTLMSGREIVAETAALSEAGRGMCVGRPLPGLDVRVIPIRDDPIPHWDDALALPPGEVGEIVVKGPVVTRTYVNRPDATARAKIRAADGGIWHRMGDVGYFDVKGRLWFCGRKAHRVETPQGTLFPVPCEAIFNRHPDVARTALVGVGPRGEQRPVLVVEPKPGAFPRTEAARERFAATLLALGAEYEHTRPIRRILFYPHPFPVDVRHNAKIRREELAAWAEARLGAPRRLRRRPRRWRDVAYTGGRWNGPAFSLMPVAILGLAIGAVVWLRARLRHRGRPHTLGV